MYTKRYQVEYFMCHQNGLLKPTYLIHMLSDIMGRNAASYGASFEYHLKRNLVWVLVNYEIDIKRLPRVDEVIIVGTLPYSFKKMYGYRVYQIRDSNGEVLVEGKGKFVLLNYQTKTLAIPNQELLDLFIDAHKEPLALPFKRIRSMEKSSLIYEQETIVNPSYIDVNGHMNNAIYMALAYDFSPKDFFSLEAVNRIYISYKKEAFVDDPLTLRYFQDTNLKQVQILSKDSLLSEITIETKLKSMHQVND